MKKKSAKGPAGSGLEWVGGVVSMPGYVTGEGEPYRPDVILWLIPGGPIVGATITRPGEWPSKLVEQFLAATRAPMAAPPHVPSRVRVASPEVAERLRAGLSAGVEVVCAPTPEIDEAVRAMAEHMGASHGEDDESYLGPGIDAEAVAAFFRAAARFYRAKPWGVVPDDTSLFGVSIPQLGVDQAVVSVIGQAGESFGMLLFASLDDFEEYLDGAAAAEGGERPRLPPFTSLDFERGADMSKTLRKEIARHGWEVAAQSGYPWIRVIDRDLVARPPVAREMAAIEAIAHAFAEQIEAKSTLARAWETGRKSKRKVKVATIAGPVEVTLTAPVEPRTVVVPELVGGPSELEVAVLERFASSKEGKSLGREPFWAPSLVEIARLMFLTPLDAITGAHLRTFLMEAIPGATNAEPRDAPDIVGELRAFFSFLKRELKLSHTDECLAELGPEAEAELARALAVPDQPKAPSRAPAQKAPAKKAPAKKEPAKEASAKKAPAKKAPAKKGGKKPGG